MKCFSWWSTKQPKLRPTKQCQIPPPGRLSNCSLIMDAASCMVQETTFAHSRSKKWKVSVHTGFLFVGRWTQEQKKGAGRQVVLLASNDQKKKHLGTGWNGQCDTNLFCLCCLQCFYAHFCGKLGHLWGHVIGFNDTFAHCTSKKVLLHNRTDSKIQPATQP